MNRAPRRWIHEGEAPHSVADVLALLGEPLTAVVDGRVFVGKRRVRDAAEPVPAGSEVVVHPAAEAGSTLSLVGKVDGLFVVDKPSGLPTEPDRKGARSVVSLASAELGATVHAVTRLDVRASGLVVLAAPGEATRLATSLKERGALLRRYVALGGGAPTPPSGTWSAPIGRGARGHWVIGGRESRAAETRYAVLSEKALAGNPARVSLIAAELITGRTHQIRLHAANAGAPLLGDVEHGGARRLTFPDGRVQELGRLALHASRVELRLEGEAPVVFEAPHPAELVGSWLALGGSAADFDTARQIVL